MANYSQRYNATTQTTTAGAFKFDTITSVDWPVAKLIWGDEGTATYASASNPLPVTISGVSTAALQTTANGILTTMDVDTGAIATSVASLDAKAPALGQALATASVPVVLTAAQVSTLTPPAAITGFATAANQLPDGHNVTIDNASIAVTGTFWQATQPVSGTVTANIGTVSTLATAAAQATLETDVEATNTRLGEVQASPTANTVLDRLKTGNASLASIDAYTISTYGVIVGNIQDWTEITKDSTSASATSLALLDDSVVAVDAVGTSAKVLMQGAIRDDALSALTPIEGDAVNLRTDANGALWVIPSGTTTIAGAVTNAGTFAVQVSSALPAGTNNIGDVDVLSLPALPTGTNSIGQVTANAGTNLNTSALALESGGNLAAIATSLAALDNAVATNGTTALNQVIAVGGYNSNNGWINALQADDNGALYIAAINPLATTASGSTAHDVALSDSPVAMGGYASAAAPTSVSADGDVTYVWCLRNGSPVVNLAVGGTLVTGSAGLPVAQQGTFTVGLSAAQTLATVTTVGTVSLLSNTTQLTPGTAAANLGKAEDAAHANGDVGVMALAVRKDTAAASSGTTGDYEPLSTDATGRLWVVGAGIEDAAETAGGVLLMAGSVRRDTAASSAGTTGDNATINTDSVGALWTRDTATQVDDAAFTPATSRVVPVGFLADETATDSVDEGDGGAARMTLDRKQIVTPQPHTAGGLSIFRSLDLDETEEEVKATAGQIYGGFVTNTSTGTRWIKFYNATAANTTVGTTTPVITWGIQGGATDDVAAVLNLGGMGIEFTTAISVAATTGVADADTGAPGANDVIINLFYK